MYARQSMFESDLFGDALQRAKPLINKDGSDSGIFDNTLELMTLAGRSLPHAMMMMVPEPWTAHESMSEEKKGVLRIPRLPDGTLGRPCLHRLHRRHHDGRSPRPATVCAPPATP